MEIVESEGQMDKRTLTEANLVTVASSLNLYNNFKSKPNFKSSISHTNMRHSALMSGVVSGGTSSNLKDSWRRSGQNSGTSKNSFSTNSADNLSNLPLLYESGLFEAARFANPVLPQYHPKLLMELLNFGKTRRVKAILAHLVRCISGTGLPTTSGGGGHTEEDDSFMDGLLSTNAPKPRSMSMRSDANTVNTMEIKSIPPLPLYALITADRDLTSFHSEFSPSTQARGNDYSDLLDTNLALNKETEDLDAQLFSSSSPENPRSRLHSDRSKSNPIDPYNFTPSQTEVLQEYLSKLNLPGLSGNDQFYLAALAEVVASFSQDFSDLQAGNAILL